jgi:hypothetical protein
MDDKEELSFEVSDLSGGVQVKTTEYQRKNNQLEQGINTRYDTVGGVKKGKGYAQVGSDLTSTTSTSTSTTSTSTSTSTSSSSSTSTSTTTTA